MNNCLSGLLGTSRLFEVNTASSLEKRDIYFVLLLAFKFTWYRIQQVITGTTGDSIRHRDFTALCSFVDPKSRIKTNCDAWLFLQQSSCDLLGMITTTKQSSLHQNHYSPTDHSADSASLIRTNSPHRPLYVS